MRRTAASVFVIASLIASLIAAGAANAQSFDCRGAHHPDEQAICRDPTLSKLDNRLAAAFAKTLNQLSPPERKELADDEEDWVVSRHRCGADASCIAEEYRNRIRELTGVMPPPGALRPNPPAVTAGPPFPIVQPPPPPAVVERPPFPALERPQPAPERTPPAVEKQPPAKAVEQQPLPAAEQQPQAKTEQRSQTKVELREQTGSDSRAQQGSEDREQPAAERQQQPNAENRPQSSPERKQPAAAGNGTTTGKEDRQERKPVSHEVRKTPTETNPAAEPAVPERDADVVKTTSRPHRKSKQNHRAAASVAASAPAPSAGSPAKPSIQWVDPPPSR